MTVFLILLAICALLLAIDYRFRGGGFITATDTICRFVWGAGLAVCYLILSAPDVNWYFVPLVVVLGFLIEALIPHAFAQNMGRRTQAWTDMPPITVATIFGKTITLPKYWPAYFLKPFLAKISLFWQDFIGMASVGFLRGVMVFAPKAALDGNVIGAVLAIVTITILQPLGYLLGFITPFTIDSSLTAKSTTWGEFYNGASWAVALAVSEI